MPALIVTLPLTGFALQAEERRAVVRAAREFGSNPLAVAGFAVDTTGLFLRAGNFRPLGRFVEKAEHAFALEAAEATGLSLHSVQGGLRLALVALLALAAARVVAAVMRSSGVLGSPRLLLGLYSLVLGGTLVASHHIGALTAFPVLFLGSPLLIVGVLLAVARDADMQDRPLAWHEHATMALLGAAAAMVYDLVYVAPPLAAVFIVVRARAAGLELRQVVRTAAVRRWAALAAGFLAVFVPVRAAIAALCSVQYCNPASEVVLGADAAGVAVERVLTGLPPAAWAHTADRVSVYGYRDGLGDLAGNWLIVVLVAAAGLLCARAARGLVQSGRARAARGLVQSGRAGGDELAALRRFAAALATLGAFTVLAPAMLVSLSKQTQTSEFAVGELWRDGLVVQLGWSLVFFAAIVAVLAWTRSRAGWSVVAAAVAAVLWVGLSVTLLNNYRLGHVGRGTPTTALVRQISTSVVRADLTADGNARRCDVIDAYVDLWPDPQGWWRGPQLREELNHYMLDRYGVLFCDGPGQETELTSDPPADWDWFVRDVR